MTHNGGRQSGQGESSSLQACPKAPRCVSSEVDRNSAKFIEPIVISDISLQDVRDRLVVQIEAMGGSITNSDTHHLTVTFTSRAFGFVDDLEVWIDVKKGLIQVRSGARIGYYDFEVNRKRVNELRVRMK